MEVFYKALDENHDNSTPPPDKGLKSLESNDLYVLDIQAGYSSVVSEKVRRVLNINHM
jgi:hypothetical protein